MRILRADLWRMGHTGGLWVGAAGILLATFVSMGAGLWVELGRGLEQGYHVTLLLAALDADLSMSCIPICAALAYGTAFVEELDTGYVRLYVSRCPSADYVRAKALTPVLGGAASVGLGVLGSWLAVALLYGPFEAAATPGVGYPLGMLLTRLLLSALGGGLWAAVGALVANVTRSKYTAYAAPFILYYVLVMLQERYLTAWVWLSPKAWMTPPGCCPPFRPPGSVPWRPSDTRDETRRMTTPGPPLPSGNGGHFCNGRRGGPIRATLQGAGGQMGLVRRGQ